MTRKFHIKLLSFLMMFGGIINTVYAQKEIDNKVAEIKAIATVTEKNIMLRWGVTTPTAWKHSNKYGFIIERRTIVKDQAVLKQPIIKILNTIPLKPKPMMEWKKFTEKNTNAAIAAQALYGEQFDVSMKGEMGL